MSRFRMRAVSSVLLLLMMILCVPALAYAGVSEYQVQFAPVGLNGRMDLIVNVVLSPDTELPAKVRVPLPAGATVVWAGEILGGIPDDDPQREVTLTKSGDGQYAEFTLEQVRIAQVEAELPQSVASGDKVNANLTWLNTTDAGTYTFSVRLEPKIADIKITPAPEGLPQTNADGESLYTLTPLRLEKDGTFDIEVAYSRGGAATGSGGALSPILIIAVGLLVVAVAALIVVVVRQNQSASVESSAKIPTPVSGGGRRSSVDAAAKDVEPENDDEAFTWE
ncbi:MAG: hypothetical protein CVT66_05290 [Actinobacteria bacterium HGW-Actinobacteria-6]|nr:MAG: hypothetical protein CVT66_05290 [Actinobacteria bacterium HGW-Actinobacteria-6]